MKKFLSVLVRILVTIIIATGVCYLIYSYSSNWRYLDQKNLVFTVEDAKGGEAFDVVVTKDQFSKLPNATTTINKLRKGVYSKNWGNEDTLVVKAVDWYNCGAGQIWGSYKIEDDKITIFSGKKSFGLKLINVAEACIYSYVMTYEISNLEYKDYQITYVRAPYKRGFFDSFIPQPRSL
ncbi:MAG: hypothetical protein A2V96_01685 [Candidatus Yonathbacteria bacterium RBG_16_43_6]|uniref:Uncharacterized protein n=1 Tax=Candidatus Yonathbacteria bacterium RIFCSPLOWO2_01_FULL_43_27 TaxID=1802726 RepID=A0A1G2SC30_9BACT|nr:MAG: hypothetical protein A2V96_01685 [Candidatus Yonathbacteria bacterium RBG_16_43_6]OHA78950.1 MAG: hypothetical protein A2658_01280 [Candidatus Yonathbacteria bacterium RIFCSPHIGHO2_01_FULL_44_19]OHA82587.1 MAG: hypothetical protein A3B07_01485 [Candidatus Yonathbacteria bacterium RIFCSPLOWO2_01_FULL_43_27]